MPDEKPEDQPDAELVSAAKANADEIKRNEATQSSPRGNVYSEEEDGTPGHDAPPPFPH